MHANATLKVELEAQSADHSAGDPWRLFVAGDCYFRRDTSPTADSILAPDLQERIANTDLAIANFEAPIRTTDATPRAKSGPGIW